MPTINELGYAIGFGAGLFITIAFYIMAFIVTLEAIKRLFRGRK